MLFFTKAKAQEFTSGSPTKSDSVQACDYILFKTGNELFAKIVEVNNSEVKYFKCNDSKSELITVSKCDVFIIRFSNGVKQVYTESFDPSQKSTIKKVEKKKYAGSFTWGIGKSFDGNQHEVVNLDFVNGLRKSNGFILGLGIGGRFSDRRERLLVPVYINLKFEISETKNIPYVALNPGLAIDLSRLSDPTSVMFGVKAGVMLKLSRTLYLDMDLSFEPQTITGAYSTIQDENPFSFNIGLAF